MTKDPERSHLYHPVFGFGELSVSFVRSLVDKVIGGCLFSTVFTDTSYQSSEVTLAKIFPSGCHLLVLLLLLSNSVQFSLLILGPFP